MKAFATAALFAAALMVAPVQAGIIIETGNNPQPNEENILFNQLSLISMGTTVTGVTNQSNLIVDFTSNVSLTTPSAGQARVTASTGTFNNYMMTLPGATFQDYIFNLNVSGNTSGTATIQATGTTSTASETFNIGVGQNFFTLYTTGGEALTGVQVNTTVPLTDVRQNRISGAQTTTGAVPEPASMLMLGSGLIGVAVLGRRKKLGAPSSK